MSISSLIQVDCDDMNNPSGVLKCRARLNNSSFQMRIMLQPRTVNNYTKLPISNQAVEGTVCHLHLTYNSDQKQSLDYWKQIDIKISTFVELEGVELAWVTPSSPFTPKGHQGEENENKTYGRDIAKCLILTRERCQIKVMVDSTSITEEDIRSQESLVQTQLVVDDKLD